MGVNRNYVRGHSFLESKVLDCCQNKSAKRFTVLIYLNLSGYFGSFIYPFIVKNYYVK